MMKLIDYAALTLLVMLPMVVSAEQSQQQQPKNYPALIAQNGRAICEENLAQILEMNDGLKTQIAALKAELAELKKEPKPE